MNKDEFVSKGMKRVNATLKAQPHRGNPNFDDVKVVAKTILEHLADAMGLEAAPVPQSGSESVGTKPATLPQAKLSQQPMPTPKPAAPMASKPAAPPPPPAPKAK